MAAHTIVSESKIIPFRIPSSRRRSRGQRAGLEDAIKQWAAIDVMLARMTGYGDALLGSFLHLVANHVLPQLCECRSLDAGAAAAMLERVAALAFDMARLFRYMAEVPEIPSGKQSPDEVLDEEEVHDCGAVAGALEVAAKLTKQAAA